MYESSKARGGVVLSLHGYPKHGFKQRPAYVLAVAASLLGACGNKDVLGAELDDGNQAMVRAALPPPSLIGREAVIIQEIGAAAKVEVESAKARERATAAMQKVLFDPGSAQFLNLRLGKNDAVCGKYNAKNRYGAYVGFRDFVVTKEGNPVTSANNDGLASVPRDYFAMLYLNSCASAKERSDYLALTEPAYEYPEPTPEAPSDQEYQEPDAILDAPVPSASPNEETT